MNFCADNNLRLTVIGWTNGDYTQVYKRPLPRNVSFKGVMSNSEISDLLLQHDLLLLPSCYKSEAQPLTLLEGACIGCYTITNKMDFIIV